MLNSVRSPRRRLAALLGAVMLAACTDGSPLEPAASDAPRLARSSGATSGSSADVGLLSCPTVKSRSASAVIGAQGGKVKAGLATLVIPAGAVQAPTEFTVTVPQSPYLEVELTASGYDHYVFASPVQIELSYKHCGDRKAELPVSAWYIDSESKSLLEEMSGSDTKSKRTIRFRTTHLSGYALAYRTGGGTDEAVE